MVGEQHVCIEGTTLDFILDIEEFLQLHQWATEVNELWLVQTGALLYKMAEEHPIMCFCNKLDDPQDFAITLTLKHFQSLELQAGAEVFQKVVSYLYNVSTNGTYCKPQNIGIAFYSKTSPHYILGVYELCSGNLRIGVVLNGFGM